MTRARPVSVRLRMTDDSNSISKFDYWILRITTITERGLISADDARLHVNHLITRTMDADFRINSVDNLEAPEVPGQQGVTINVMQGDNRKMTNSDKSVSVGGNILGSSVVTGDHNTVTTTARVTLPPAHTVDARAELAALRKALAKLQVPDRDRLDRAFKDAEEEAAKPSPDKEYVGEAVQRVLKVAKGTNEFADQLETLTPRLTALAGWIGPAGRALLSLVGLTA
jgi:hypothetical protein